jgi:hypothetical protein
MPQSRAQECAAHAAVSREAFGRGDQRQINVAEYYKHSSRMRSARSSSQRGLPQDDRQINAAGLFGRCFSNKNKIQSVARTARVNR